MKSQRLETCNFQHSKLASALSLRVYPWYAKGSRHIFISAQLLNSIYCFTVHHTKASMLSLLVFFFPDCGCRNKHQQGEAVIPNPQCYFPHKYVQLFMLTREESPSLLPSLQYSTTYPSRPEGPTCSGASHVKVTELSFTSSTVRFIGAPGHPAFQMQMH